MSLLESAPSVAGLLHHQPPDVHSLAAADEAAELYAAYRHPLDDEQRRTLDGAMAERSDGSWAASEVADFKARQTGKGDTIECRELAGLILCGETLQLHTAHEFPTANEAFLRMASLFENYDDLRRRVARVRYANGEQGVELLTGQRLKYKARTGGGGRGFAGADLVVLDEAQHLRPEHLAAVGPTITANPNAQIWSAGSGGLEQSEVAWKLRKRALAGNAGRLAYTERTAELLVPNGDGTFSLEAPTIVDPLDHDLLMRAHSGYASGRVGIESLETLLKSMGFDLFIRECLCIWMPEPSDERHDRPIPLQVWDMLERPTVDYDRTTARLAVAVAHDRSWATIGLAAVNELGFPQLRLVAGKPGTGWVAARAAELAAELGGKVAVLKGEPVIEDMQRAGVDVHETTQAELATATGRLIDATSTEDGHTPTLRHQGAPELRKALEIAETRPYGDNAQVWSARNSSGDISPLTAVTMAYGRLGQGDDGPSVYEERGLAVI